MSDILLNQEINYSLSSNIKKSFLVENKILPLKEQELCILLATSHKTTFDTKQIDKFVQVFKKPVKFIVVDENSLQKELIDLEFKQKLFTLANHSLEYTNKQSENSYIIEFMNHLFSYSIKNSVSDIHFETLDKSVIIRVRIDGELNQIFRFQIELYPLISAIVKYFGNLDISQRRLPLNGRLTQDIDGKNYDMRISTLPTIHGESIVLRILDNRSIKKDIDIIGFDTYSLNSIKKAISLTQGLVLVTGPTGSGKTTSLYSMLNCVNTKNKKIITIEDPVEYKIDGVMQVNINNEIDLNYHEVLKNILRQDPDILLIGEIRDSESLQIAIQASLTGHLVLATLHTNSAVETLTRLLDLKAEPYLIATTLKMILSQRLVRILCNECKVKDKEGLYYVQTGCKKCNYTGYINRQVVSEVLDIDDTISQLIVESNNLQDIKKHLKQKEYKTIKENTMRLVDNGLTTIEEYYSKV